MAKNTKYIDLKNRSWNLSALDAHERRLVAALQKQAQEDVDWNDFDNSWMSAARKLYAARGLSGRDIPQTPVYQIAQDLSNRIALRKGLARPVDYRDELEEIINQRFKTRRAFCEATGLAEDMLSHVLARRKHLAIDTLEQALFKIGYALHLKPVGR